MKAIESIIAKVLADEQLGYEEKTRFDEWMNTSEDNQRLFHRLQQHWQSGGLKVEIQHTERVKKRFNEKVGKKLLHVQSNQAEDVRTKQYGFSYFWRIAAVLTLLLVAGAFFYNVNQTLDKPKTPEPIEALLIRQVPNGTKATYTLSDGTIIKVNANSEIKFPKVFPADRREVYLEGEAFFDVAEDANRPFIIHSGDIKTTVLGTSFNINAYQHEQAVKVAVVSGKVTVEAGNEDEKVLLVKEQMLVYDKTLEQAGTQQYDAEMELGWKDNVLVFKQATIAEIVAKMEQWYGYKLVMKQEKTLKKGYRGRFKDETIESVLESMSYSLKWRYQIDHATKTVNIY